MGIIDHGTSGQTLAAPSLAAWAASVAAVLDNSDTPISARLAALTARVAALEAGGGTPPATLTIVDNGDGSATVTTAGLTDNGNGSATFAGTAFDNGDGSATLTAA